MLRKDVNYFVVLPVVLIGGALLGALVEILFIRRFKDAPRLIVTVATIGVSLLLLVLEFQAQTSITGELVTSSDFRTPFTRFGFDVNPLRFTGDFVVAAVVTAIICALLGAFFRFTDMGIAVRASAENGERAALLGIPVRRVSTVVWIIAAVLSAVAVFLRAPMVGLTLGSSIGPSVLLYGLAAAVVARMDSLPLCIVAGMGIGIIDQSALYGTRKASLSVAIMLVVILVALLAQRARLARAFDTAIGTWQSVKEYRPIPSELRDTTEVGYAKSVLAALVLFVSVTLPLLLPDRFAGRFTLVVIVAIVGVSLVILTGWSGQISLGQFGFAGVGAGVAGALATNLHADFFVCVLAAGVAGAITAVLIGLPALRIQGLFLAVTTLAFAFTVQYFLLNPDYFGWALPEQGEVVGRPRLYGRFDVSSDTRFYFLCLFFLGLSLLAARSLRRNRSGRIMIGVRDNGRGVQAYGVNLARTRLAAFAISGFIAAIAGALLAFKTGSVDATTFSPERSISVFTIAVIGGLTSLPGAMLGRHLGGGCAVPLQRQRVRPPPHERRGAPRPAPRGARWAVGDHVPVTRRLPALGGGPQRHPRAQPGVGQPRHRRRRRAHRGRTWPGRPGCRRRRGEARAGRQGRRPRDPPGRPGAGRCRRHERPQPEPAHDEGCGPVKGPRHSCGRRPAMPPTLPLLVLFLLNMVDELDQVTYGVLAPNIRDTFGVAEKTVVTVGSLSAALVIMLVVPVGYRADRRNRLHMVSLAALVWGSMTLLTGLSGFVGAFGLLVLARFGAGIGRVMNEPVHVSLLADYYPPMQHGRIFSIHRAANAIGGGMVLLCALLADLVGWRLGFMLLAVPTFIAWTLLTRLDEPVRGASVDQALAVRADEVAHKIPFTEAWRRLKGIPSLKRSWWAGLFIGASVVPIAIFLNFFFEKVYGVESITARGAITTLYHLGSLVGLRWGSKHSTKALMEGELPRLSTLGGLTLIGSAAALLCLALAPWIGLSIVFVFVIGMGVSFNSFGLPVLAAVTPPRLRSQALGYFVFFVGLGAILLSPIAAGIGEEKGYRYGIALLSGLLVVAGVIYASMKPFIRRDAEQAYSTLMVEAGIRSGEAAGTPGALLTCRGVEVAYGQVQVLFGVDLDVDAGRDRGAARHERRGQVHPAARDQRHHRSASAGPSSSRAATSPTPTPARRPPWASSRCRAARPCSRP